MVREGVYSVRLYILALILNLYGCFGLKKPMAVNCATETTEVQGKGVFPVLLSTFLPREQHWEARANPMASSSLR
jgi:hypothetical protein